MVETYIKEIEERLQKIQKESEENISRIIDIETSTDYCVGSQLVAYGRIYKVVFKATSYEEAIRNLEKLKTSSLFEVDTYYDTLVYIQNKLIDNMKKGTKFEYDSQMEICMEIENNLIMDTVLN